jgi:hypothetical protein
MTNLRRQFLWCIGAAFTLGFCGSILPQSPKMPTPPEPAGTDPRLSTPTGHGSSQRALLQPHEREFRESLAQLSERVDDSKAEVQRLQASGLFSVKIYKPSSEIEHLAKQLKNLARS